MAKLASQRGVLRGPRRELDRPAPALPRQTCYGLPEPLRLSLLGGLGANLRLLLQEISLHRQGILRTGPGGSRLIEAYFPELGFEDRRVELAKVSHERPRHVRGGGQPPENVLRRGGLSELDLRELALGQPGGRAEPDLAHPRRLPQEAHHQTQDLGVFLFSLHSCSSASSR